MKCRSVDPLASALTERRYNPALTERRYNPALTECRYNPALTECRYNPALTECRYNPALTERHRRLFAETTPALDASRRVPHEAGLKRILA